MGEVRYTLVTGACGGLGGAFVERLARRGELLFLTGRDEGRLETLVRSLKERYPDLSAEYFPCDLSNEVSRRRFFGYAEEKGATFSRLVYVAGVDVQKAFERYDEEKLLLQTRVNFEGAVSLIGFVLRHADLDGNLELLTVGSVSGLYPMPYFALYSATKKSLEQFCSALRAELRGRAKVTCALPGAIPTREDVKRNIRAQGLWGKLAALPPDEVAKRCLKAVKHNRRAPVIGFWNQLMRVSTALLPLSFKMKFIEKKWSKTEKDAF